MDRPPGDEETSIGTARVMPGANEILGRFRHRFIAAPKPGRALLLFHGTGGNEDDLLPLGRALDPGAALLGVRGQVLENGAPRYFRRLAEGVFDEADVVVRANAMAEFIAAAVVNYRIAKETLVAIGYSNGANLAAAMLLLGLGSFHSAILFRAMVPLSHPPEISLQGRHVLISAGVFDPIVTVQQTEALSVLLRERGAQVDLKLQDSGHDLSTSDIVSGRDWLASTPIA